MIESILSQTSVPVDDHYYVGQFLMTEPPPFWGSVISVLERYLCPVGDIDEDERRGLEDTPVIRRYNRFVVSHCDDLIRAEGGCP